MDNQPLAAGHAWERQLCKLAKTHLHFTFHGSCSLQSFTFQWLDVFYFRVLSYEVVTTCSALTRQFLQTCLQSFTLWDSLTRVCSQGSHPMGENTDRGLHKESRMIILANNSLFYTGSKCCKAKEDTVWNWKLGLRLPNLADQNIQVNWNFK